MARLIYGMITSLDGYTEDERGRFGWGAPEDEDVHSYINELGSSVGTYLYGRRMYEVMAYWETAHPSSDQPEYIRDYAEIWQSADKIVYSKTLETVSSDRTRIEPEFDPEAVTRMKGGAAQDLGIGGPELASQAIEAGLVDEYHFFLAPVAVGGGKRSLPGDARLDLELLDERRFGNGMVHLHYRSGA